MHPPTKHMSALAVSWAMLVVAGIFSLCIRQTEAGGGGKGKGGRGHIIVQNEVKSNQVPVYMPIPIPIPMPMGPPPGAPQGPPPAPPHHHGFGQHEDDEPEVRKVYLLQPMPRARPQPQLKGGGFMGPIQNHIHFSQHEQTAGKHRHAGGHGGHYQQQQQQQQISQEGDSDTRPHEKHAGIKSASSDVKILPIVVIPPVAPMPPIQIPSSPSSQSSSNTHRLMFSPHFNNILVSGDRTKRRHRHHGSARFNSDSFSDYGGSMGGSVFRDNYIGRGRSGRGRMSQAGEGPQHYQGLSSGRSPDFDYADFDYDNLQPVGAQSSYGRSPDEVPRRRFYRITASESFPVQRRNQRHFLAQSSSEANRLRSIRDIIEAQKAARYEDYDQAVNNEQQADYFGPDNDGNGLTEGQSTALSSRRFAHTQSGGNFEISLDDLSNQLAAAETKRQIRQQRMGANGQDLSNLYYDHGDLLSSSSKVVHKPAGSGSQEGDIFEDDQWRFDSIKSVKHTALNATMTPASNSPGPAFVEPSRPKSTSKNELSKLDSLSAAPNDGSRSS